MSNSNDLKNLQPGATYTVQIVPKNTGNDAEGKVSSINYTFTVPTTYGGSALQSLNSVVTQFIDGTGALVSGSGGGPLSPSSTMFIDGAGLKAFNNTGASTVYISSEDGNAFFSGSIVSSAGSIGGWVISPGLLSSSVVGSASTFVGISSSGNSGYAFWAGDPNPASAKFSVTRDGILSAVGASISVANIGGWTVSSSSLYGGSGSNFVGLTPNGSAAFFAGATSSVGSDAKFYVTPSGSIVAQAASFVGPILAGTVTASTANFQLGSSGSIVGGAVYVPNSSSPLFSVNSSGALTATSGSIGGWTIGTNKLSSGSITLDSTSGNQKIYIGVGNYVNSDTPFYVDKIGNFSLLNQLFFSPTASANSGDFSQLTVVGKIRGAIENVDLISNNKLYNQTSSVSISAASIATITTASNNLFLTGENVIISGLTGNASVANGAFPISSVSASSFSVLLTQSFVAGTYAISSGSIQLRELTLGLHPSENGGASATNTYGHDQGIGIRLDPYNWWFTNNQFRVGTSGTYFKYDGTKLKLGGAGSNYALELSTGTNDTNNYFAIYNPVSGYSNTYSNLYTSGTGVPSFNDINTPFYVDATGQFSLGQKLKFDTSGNLYVSGSVFATAGYIGGTASGWSINSGYIRSTGGTSSITLDGANGKIYIGTGTAGNSNTAFYADGTGSVTIKDRLIFDGTNLSITGAITATSGSIGGFGITSSSFNSTYTSSSVTTNFYIYPQNLPTADYNAAPVFSIKSSTGTNYAYVEQGFIQEPSSSSITTSISPLSSYLRVGNKQSGIANLKWVTIYSSLPSNTSDVFLAGNPAIEWRDPNGAVAGFIGSWDTQTLSFENKNGAGYFYVDSTGNFSAFPYQYFNIHYTTVVDQIASTGNNDAGTPAGKFSAGGNENGLLVQTLSTSFSGANAFQINQWRSSTSASTTNLILARVNVGVTATNAFRVGGSGIVYGNGAFQTSGADYAEMFEWYDGNINNENRIGYSVKLIQNKIIPATENSEEIIGIISINPSVLGDSAWNHWHDQYLKDDFENIIYEDDILYQWYEANPNEFEQTSLKKPLPDVLKSWQKGMPEIEIPESASTTIISVPKLNPNFNPNDIYTPREYRPEWDAVGMMGKLRLLKGQPVNPRWIKMRDVSDTVEEWLVR
jgi:hypothetical protein